MHLYDVVCLQRLSHVRLLLFDCTYNSVILFFLLFDGSSECRLENCSCDMKSPRKLNAFIAELKMKLAAKDAQIQRLEVITDTKHRSLEPLLYSHLFWQARLSTYSAEADKLENIRGDLINFVERSKAGLFSRYLEQFHDSVTIWFEHNFHLRLDLWLKMGV